MVEEKPVEDISRAPRLDPMVSLGNRSPVDIPILSA
jgi:hypothetical protein